MISIVVAFRYAEVSSSMRQACLSIELIKKYTQGIHTEGNPSARAI